ncbi:MAG: alpha/beta fold hydrolase [Ginsengibacter sp.]
MQIILSGCKIKPDKKKNVTHPLTGRFAGYFEYKGKRLNTTFYFDSQNNKQLAFISIPDNLQLDKPFTKVVYDSPHINLSMEDGEQTITIKALLNKDKIGGTLKNKIPANIYLTKVDNYKPPVKNYTIEEVVLNNNGLKLNAKLYLPKTIVPSAAIIMVSGSGAHVKEEYNGGADMFATAGIATLIFDKRNVTNFPELNLKHINSDIATMSSLVSDVETAFNFLKARKEINFLKIGLIGFSLGAVEVPVVAAKHPDIAFIIAVSGNVTTDKEFIINQGINLLKEKNYSTAITGKANEIYNKLFQYADNKANKKQLQASLDSAFREGWGQFVFPSEVPSDDELKYLMTWNNYTFDPAYYWQKINVPCLVVYGEKDRYIPVERSIDILNKIFSNKKQLLTLKLYPNADHTITTIPQPGSFDFPKYADGYISELTQWLSKQVK